MIYFQILRTVDEILGSEGSKLIFDLQRMKECEKGMVFQCSLVLNPVCFLEEAVF